MRDAGVMRDDRKPWLAVAAALVLLALWRSLVASGIPFSVDEAYYIAWSKTPDVGYWTKPPMIAWAIGAARAVCGESPGCVRMVPVLAFPLSTVMLILLALRLRFSRMQAGIAGLAFATMPLASFYGIAATTDGLLLLFWIAAMLALRVALEGSRGAWLLAGLCAGLALLSKYSAGIFAVSAVMVLLHPSWRHWWRSPWPWLAAVVAALVFLPNLWWNLMQGMPTLRHTAEISQHAGYSLRPMAMLEFLVSQFGLAGPLLFGGFIAWLASRRWKATPDGWFLLSLSVPFLVVISLQALMSRAHANWAAPAMAAGCLAAVHYLSTFRRRWIIASFAFNLVLAAVLYHFDVLVRAPLDLPRVVRTDPFWATRNWPGIAASVADTLAKAPAGSAPRVASDDRAVLAQLQAALVLPPGAALGWQRTDHPDNHFDQRFPLPASPEVPVLLVTSAAPEAVLAAYPRATPAGKARSAVIPDRPLVFSLWWLLPQP